MFKYINNGRGHFQFSGTFFDFPSGHFIWFFEYFHCRKCYWIILCINSISFSEELNMENRNILIMLLVIIVILAASIGFMVLKPMHAKEPTKIKVKSQVQVLK